MGYLQLTRRLGISCRFVRKHDNNVAGVVFHRIDIPVRWVYPNATVELDIRLRADDHPSGFGRRGVGQSIVQPAEYSDAPRITVLKKYFVALSIDTDGAIDRSRVQNVTDRRTRYVHCP